MARCLAKSLFLIQRLHDLLKDPEVVVPASSSKELLIPVEYQNLRQQLREFILYGNDVDGPRRFSPFENAGFFPFKHKGGLSISTPKGWVRIC